MRKRAVLAAFLIGAGLAAPAVRAESPAPDLRAPTADEIDALAKNCPWTNRRIAAGAVVADGRLFEAPLLVTSDMDRILIDGVQVSPRPLADADSRARKIADRLHSRFYLDEKGKVSGAAARVEKGLEEAKASGEIDDFKIWKHWGKLAAFRVQAGKGQALEFMDVLPRPLAEKDRFIIGALIREFRINGDAAWLKARLEELKAAGTVAELQWAPEEETVRVRLPGENKLQDYLYGKDTSPFALAYENRWKTRRKRSDDALAALTAKLEAGGLLVFTAAFEKSAPRDEAALSALRAVRAGEDAGAAAAVVKKRLKLTDDQARVLLDEMK